MELIPQDEGPTLIPQDTGEFNPKSYARDYSIQQGVDPELTERLIGHESGWRGDARPIDPKTKKPLSSAYGYTQLLEGTAAELGVDPKDPKQNIEGGVRYLKKQLDKYGIEGVSAYHMGPTAYDDYKEFGGDLPSATKQYRDKILTGYQGNGYYTKQGPGQSSLIANPTGDPNGGRPWGQPSNTGGGGPTLIPQNNEESIPHQLVRGTVGMGITIGDFVGALAEGIGGGALMLRDIGAGLAVKPWTGQEVDEILRDGQKKMEAFGQYTSASNWAKKMGVPEDYINNPSSTGLQKILDKPGEIGSAVVRATIAYSHWLTHLTHQSRQEAIEFYQDPSKMPLGGAISDTLGMILGWGGLERGGRALGNAVGKTIPVKPETRSPGPSEPPPPPSGGPINPDRPAEQPWGTKEKAEPTLIPQDEPVLTDAQFQAEHQAFKDREIIASWKDAEVGGKKEPALGTGEVPAGTEPQLGKGEVPENRAEPVIGEETPKSKKVEAALQEFEHIMKPEAYEWNPEDMGRPRGPRDVEEPRTDIQKTQTPEERERQTRYNKWQDEADAQYETWKKQNDVLKDEGRRQTETETAKYKLGLENPEEATKRVEEQNKKEAPSTFDIKLLPEAAQKDGVLIKENNKRIAAETKLEELKQEANGVTALSEERTKAIETEIKEQEKKRDVAKSHVETRLQNKYDINFSNLRNEESVYTPSSPGRLKIEDPKTAAGRFWQDAGKEVTLPKSKKQLAFEKTTTPSMERSSDANVTSKIKPIGVQYGRNWNKQGGHIHPDLLLGPITKLFDALGWAGREVMDLYRGTFRPWAIEDAIQKALESDRVKIALMSPEDFLRLAQDRSKLSLGPLAEDKRNPVRKALNTEEGLRDIPFLHIGKQSLTNFGHIKGHDGRHRMDVFKEKGLEKVPVRILYDSAATAKNPPKQLWAEDGRGDPVAHPEILNFGPKEQYTTPRKIGAMSPLRGPGGRQGGGTNFGLAGAIGDLLKKATKKSDTRKVTPLNRDQLHQFENDRRPAIEMIADAKKEAENLGGEMKDFDIGDWSREMYNTFTSGKSTSILSSKYPVAGKILKWVTDQGRMIDREMRNKVEDIMIGAGFGPSRIPLRPFDVRMKNGAFDAWQRLTNKDIAEMHLSALNYMKEGKEPGPSDFNSPAQWEAYKGMREGLNRTLDEVDNAREAVGLSKINRIPGYLPTRIMGDYKVIFRDSEGAVKHISGHATRMGANRLIAKMRQEMPELRAEIKPISKTKDLHSDLSAFEHTMRLMEKADPATRAVHAAYVKILSSRGFGAHGMQRKGGWTGFEGDKATYKGATEMKKAVEAYINQGLQYAGSLRKQLVIKELLDAGDTKYKSWYDRETGEFKREKESLLETEMPNTFSVAQDYITHSRGGALTRNGFEEYLIQVSSEIMGFGYNTPTRVLKSLGNIGLFTWLTRPGFWLSQFFQPMNAFPRMMKANLLEGDFSNPMVALLNGYKNLVVPDASAKAGVNWAIKNGYLSSQVLDMFENNNNWRATKQNPVETAKKVLSQWPIGKIEQEFVRTPTFLMFEYGFRKSIKDPIKRYEIAAEMTHHYMVDYTKQERAQVFQKMGMLGTAFSPLKAYPLNYFAQMAEYLGDLKVKEPKSVVPMGTFLTNGILQSGVKGIPFIAEATAAILAYNYFFNQDIPTPERALLTSDAPDWLTYGGVSTVTGVDFSNSLGAPSVGGMMSAPGASVAMNLAEGAKTFSDMARGEATPGDKLRTAKALLPSAATGWVEDAFSTHGEVPIPVGNDIKTDYVRDQTQWLIRKYIGNRTVPESKVSGQVRNLKQWEKQQEEVRGKLVSVMADQILNHKPLDPKLISKYVHDMNGDISKVPDQILGKMKDRVMTRIQTMIIEGQGYDKAQRLAKMQQFSGLLDGMSDKELIQFNDKLSSRK